MKPEVSIKSVSNGLLKGKKKYGVISGIIICGMRNMSPSDSLKLAKGTKFYVQNIEKVILKE